MKLTRLAILITLTLSARPVLATEFNVNMLNTEDRKNADLSAFSREGYIAPGNYLLDIWLNEQSVREQYPVSVVPVKGAGNEEDSVICVTSELVDMLGLNAETLSRLKPVSGTQGGRCLDLRTPDSQVRYSAAQQRLTFVIPQAWMQYQDPNWVPPARWSQGISGALLDYNLMVSRYMPQQGTSSTSYSLYGTGGLNLGAGDCGVTGSTTGMTLVRDAHSPIFICPRPICSVLCRRCVPG